MGLFPRETFTLSSPFAPDEALRRLAERVEALSSSADFEGVFEADPEKDHFAYLVDGAFRLVSKRAIYETPLFLGRVEEAAPGCRVRVEASVTTGVKILFLLWMAILGYAAWQAYIFAHGNPWMLGAAVLLAACFLSSPFLAWRAFRREAGRTREFLGSVFQGE